MPLSATTAATAAAASTAIPWAALVPIAVIELGLDIYCITDIVRHRKVRRLPLWAWIVLTLAVNPLGGIAYLLFGRSEDR